MPKGAPPAYSQRDCRFDPLVVAGLAQGFGKVLVYGGIETEERAHEIRKGVYRCAKHREVTADAGRSVLASGDDMGVHRQPDGTFVLKFRLWSKRDARKRHIERYGTDRSRWPYNPRRGKSQEDIDAWAAQGLSEKGHRVR
jgi:hypothetical protein